MTSPQGRGSTADEEVYRYYTRVIHLTLVALDDGAPSGMPPTEFIEILLGALGFDNSEDWIRFTENDAFRFAACALRLKDDFTRARFFDRNRKQRYAWLEYMEREGNPVIFEHRLQFEHAEDSQPGNLKGHHFSEYKLTIASLIRDIIAECPIGTHHETLKKAVKRHAQNYLARFEGTSKRSRKKRVASAEARLHSSFSNAAKAIRQEEMGGGREAAIRRLQEACPPELKDIYQAAFAPKISAKTAQCPHCGKSIDDNTCEVSPDWQNFRSETACNLLENQPLADLEQLSHFSAEIDVEEAHVLSFINTSDAPVDGLLEGDRSISEVCSEPIASPGMSHEEFLAATWPEGETEILSWRDEPTTQPQRDLLLKAGEFNIPTTKGEASDRIDEVIKSGRLTDFFSLEELKAFDPKARWGRGRAEVRCCCPKCGDLKPMDDDHRSMSVNMITGKYLDHRCGTKGILREYLGDAGQARTFVYTGPAKEEKSDKWRGWVKDARQISDSAGAKYLEGRGLPVEVAEAAGVKFGRWWKRGEAGPVQFPCVIFRAVDQGGNLVAAQARAITGDTKRTGGDKQEGVFLSNPDVLNANQIAIVEAPIDALILEACGVRTIATLGTTWPEWLPGALEGKDVAMAQDADQAGDECAAGLASLLRDRATVWRLRPDGAKDWSELAEREGLDAVYEHLISAMERTPEVEVHQ